MLNNILKIQEKRSWAKNDVSFFIQGLSYKIYVIIASVINRFEETIALKCLDQRKYYIAVWKLKNI